MDPAITAVIFFFFDDFLINIPDYHVVKSPLIQMSMQVHTPVLNDGQYSHHIRWYGEIATWFMEALSAQVQFTFDLISNFLFCKSTLLTNEYMNAN